MKLLAYTIHIRFLLKLGTLINSNNAISSMVVTENIQLTFTKMAPGASSGLYL